MTVEQETYLRRVQIAMQTLEVRFITPPPFIDASVFEELGYTPEQCAGAMMGHDIKTLTRVIDYMRTTGVLLLQ